VHPRRERFCKTCQQRYERNILRMLDCKNPGCQALVADLPKSHAHLCSACADHFAALRSALDAHGISCEIDGTLVRGLDSYTKTVFEYTHQALGAQDAIGAGGRYDGLVEELGGPPVPAVGFALGVERIMIALAAQAAVSPPPPIAVYGVAQGAACRQALSRLLVPLRQAGIAADMDYEGRSFKAQMRAANRQGATLCLILGETELAAQRVAIKDMREGGSQTDAPWTDLFATVRARLGPTDA